MARRIGVAALALLLVEATAACASELQGCQDEGLALLQLSSELREGGGHEDPASKALQDAAQAWSAVVPSYSASPKEALPPKDPTLPFNSAPRVQQRAAIAGPAAPPANGPSGSPRWSAATGQQARAEPGGGVEMVRQVKETRPDEWTLAHHLKSKGITTAEEACDAADVDDDGTITAADWNAFTNGEGLNGEKGDGLGPVAGADWDLKKCESILGAMVKMPETDEQESAGRADEDTPEQRFASALVTNNMRCAPLLVTALDINPKDGQIEPHEWMHFCQGYGIDDDEAMVIFKGFFSTTQTTTKAAEVFFKLGMPADMC